MFGIIPRTMWGKLIPPDENNLIEMRNNLFVLTAHGKKFLFDAGLGDSLTDKEKKIYTTQSDSTMDSGLQSLGLSENDIDYVILTHLHTDHAAGAVKEVDGEFVPRFPNAKYIVSREEFAVAMKPNERTKAVYVPQRYLALQQSGKLEIIDGNEELFPGIKALFTSGHTDGHFALEMESGGQKVFYYADIFCTSNHMAVPFVPATDLYPNQTMAIKREKLPEIISDDVIMCFDHDVHMPFGKVKQEDRRIRVEQVSE